MQSNRVKAILAQGQATVGSWLGLGCPEVAEIMANVGFDWLVVDTEHGPMDFEKAQAMLQAMNGTKPSLCSGWPGTTRCSSSGPWISGPWAW